MSKATFDSATSNFADLAEHRRAAAKDLDVAVTRIGVAGDRLGDSEYGDAVRELADEAARLAAKVRALAEAK